MHLMVFTCSRVLTNFTEIFTSLQTLCQNSGYFNILQSTFKLANVTLFQLLFFFKPKYVLPSFSKIMDQVCYLRLYYNVYSVSCHLLLRMARMEMIESRNFSNFDAISIKSTKEFAFLKYFIKYSPHSLSETFCA